ncbi:MAG: hypothetical protein HWN67_13540 [Candidatus Helarchaeota archaeon]|nr:hypothetical protein [Candidatus Helarchaeota archaeon]
MGCCGYRIKSVELVKKAINENTEEFKKFKNLEEFRDRTFKSVLRYGVCLNVVRINGNIYCPLHPKRNNGLDLRDGYCIVDHFCKTAKKFSKWNEKKQKKFLDFIKEKNLDAIEYSLKIDRGILLKEFQKTLEK